MKRLSMVLAGILVLLSSMIFSACNDGWKDVKISCETESISLVLDDDKLSTAEVVFELSGTKDWGEVNVTTQPQGLVMVENIVLKDDLCGVQIRALQPSGDGATLVITHLGADVSCSVPLKVGRKLVDMQSSGKGCVIQPQAGQSDEDVLEFEIPTKSLIVGTPENYTNTIVWKFADGQETAQIGLQNYNSVGGVIESAFTTTGDANPSSTRISGVSEAVKTVLTVSKEFSGAKEVKLNPIAVLDGQAVLYKDVTVVVYILNLDTSKICVTSDTHKYGEGLGEIVLINNPTKSKAGQEDGLYNYYSTAVLTLQYNSSTGATDNLVDIPNTYKNLYTIQTSTNIPNLSVEQVGFDSIRLTALTSCVGTGELKIKFVPKDVVGDIKQFEISVPIVCGEQASGILATRGTGVNSSVVPVINSGNGSFVGSTMLTDSNSAGEAFQFKILSENTLSALKGYKISIDKHLLYISAEDIEDGSCSYVRKDDKTLYDLTEHTGYKYQINFIKDGRQMIFYEQGGKFVSEPISRENTVYVKYVATENELVADDFSITINNFYNDAYKLDNNQFDETCITYKLTFTKQRSVEKIEVAPISVDAGEETQVNTAVGYTDDWVYHFTPAMFGEGNSYYGLQIADRIIGLNNSILSNAEKSEVELTITLSGGNGNLGWCKFNNDGEWNNVATYKTNDTFKFDVNGDFRNIIVFGKTDNGDLAYGDYQLVIKQGEKTLVTKDIKIYKEMDANDVTISITDADYLGANYLKTDFGWTEDLTADTKAEVEAKLANSYILATNKQYAITARVGADLVENPNIIAGLSDSKNAEDKSGTEYDLGLSYSYKNWVFTTGNKGSYNIETAEKNFVKITYTITMPEYNYFGVKKDTQIRIAKQIFIYIYEPVVSYRFVDEQDNIKTNLSKYAYDDLEYTPFVDEWSKQTLILSVNGQTNGSANIFNYISIAWKDGGDGIKEFSVADDNNMARYTFGALGNATKINGIIVATITQFGVSVPVYCSYEVNKPILTDRVTITNNMGVFNSGMPYLNLKVGETIQITANATSNTEQPISLTGLSYAICSTNWYTTSGVASVNANGVLTAKNAGRVKLVVVAKDRQTKNLSNVVNFSKFTQYIRFDSTKQEVIPYVILDVIVSDGSADHPYLISSSKDFENIADDFDADTKINNKFYAIVGDVNLNGKEIRFDGTFTGKIFSYNESGTISNARFTIYGVRITAENQYIFKQVGIDDTDAEYDYANFENINVYVSFNFDLPSESNKNYLLGFIGENKGYIKDCQFYVDGRIDGNSIINSYTIGTVAGVNSGVFELTDASLTGVQGSITVQGTATSTVVLGGVAGRNTGEIKGSLEMSIDNDGQVKYEVYYDSQGAMVDIDLQVKNVDTTKYDDSAIGGVVGLNSGKIYGVYSLGKVLGVDDKNQLVVNNVGGIIGKNANEKVIITATLTAVNLNGISGVGTIKYNTDLGWQIEESYSTAQVYGRDNVGGITGYDQNGEYKRAYYEIYDGTEVSIRGENNVGGLIGNGTNTSLYYCYSNSFTWDYTHNVSTYNIVAENNAGGLIGYGESSSLNGYNGIEKDGLFVVNSASSLLINSQGVTSGIIGRAKSLVAIYTAYFYGAISGNTVNAVVNITDKFDAVIANIPYNNVYSINALVSNDYSVNTLEYKALLDNTDNFNNAEGNNFAISEDYNNGKPYIKYNGANLVSVVPTIIEINASFEKYNDSTIDGFDKKWELYKENILGEYVLEEGAYREYNEATDFGKTRYTLMGELEDNSIYKEDDAGEYVLEGCVYREYNSSTDSDKTRYTKIEDGNNSNYRNKIFALYYYDFKLLDSDTAILDMQSLNSINIRSLLLDGGIISKPNAKRRFSVSSSNREVINPTSNGILVLKGEGQATITITSLLNKNASASFVVIVRSKTLKFGLYRSANCLEEYNLSGNNNNTLNIVKNTSKLIYADYSTVVTKGVNTYEYSAPTNMEIHFTIEIDETTLPEGKTVETVLNGKQIEEYITINGTKIGDEYIVQYGTPITITVNEFLKDGRFKITAKAYIILDYKSDVSKNTTNTIKIPLADYYEKTFYVATKKGVSAINLDKTKLDIMPADEVTLQVKINTDVRVEYIDFNLTTVGDVFEFEIDGEKVSTTKLLEVYYNNENICVESNSHQVNNQTYYYIDVADKFNEAKQEIVFGLTLKVAPKGYYLDEEYKLDLQFVAGNSKETIKIDVSPQQISNIMVLNYRMGESVDDLTQASLSNIIRPGSRNVLIINIAPNIAVYDYLEIVDLNEDDKVLFMQQTLGADGKLKAMPNMDKWIGDGIKLIKPTSTTSTIYAYAMLPLMATANITHTLRVTAYDKNGTALMYNDVSLEAILFPSVTVTYTYPNGQEVVADSRYAFTNDYTAEADLALGVEAGVKVETLNIDEESLEYSIEVKDKNNRLENADSGVKYADLVTFKYEQDGYMLRFNTSVSRSDLQALIGGTILVSFSASKQVNGVMESCKSTIKFTIREYVIHSISMSHTALNGKIYGFYDNPENASKREKIATEFYFDKTDISYWNGSSYWNIQYRLDNLGDDGVETKLKTILQNLNTIGTGGVTIKFGESAKFDSAEVLTSSGYNKNGITITNSGYKLVITATETSKINDMEISVEFGLKFNDNNYHVLAEQSDRTSVVTKEYEFYFEEQADPFEEYKTISSQAEFEAMLEGNYYQLKQDITLINYTPISTPISAFAGNGHTITVESFNIDQLKQEYSSGDLSIGLFGTLGEETIVQNLVVDYKNLRNTYSKVIINLSDYQVAEDGTINNINVGGISGDNLGVITNCYVTGKIDIKAPQVPPTQIFMGGITGLNGGTTGTKFATITKSTADIALNGMAMIGGIAEYNNGKISTSVFKGTILSNEESDYASSIYTAGFVVENTANASIALSAVLSSGKSSTTRDMYTVGTLSGFVSTNAGSITDCYVTDASMGAQGSIGGFVYKNSGTIEKCYSNPNLEASRFYERFIYDVSSYGEINNCYVITNDTKELKITGLTKISMSDVADKSQYVGLTFSNSKYSIWAVANGSVVLNNIGFTALDDYKSVLNIYDDVTFEGYLTLQLIDNTIQGKTFNIVRDIDLSNLTDNPTTYNKILSAGIEGNGLTISGYNIYNSGNVSQIGLFASIKQNKDNDVFVRNLGLQPASIKASKSAMVGALAGEIDGGYIYNIQIDASEVLILGKNAVGGLAGLIKGDFEIIGIKSNISAFSTFTYSVGNQYNMYLSRYGGGSSMGNIDSVSYVGGIAGIVDGYNTATLDASNRNTANRSSISDVVIDGDIVLIGETVGGAFGLVAEGSKVSNVKYDLNIASKYQSVYVAGGLVGENRGVVENSYIYNPTENDCFSGFGKLIGGIVGLNLGGLVDNCSADIWISTSTELATIGGIVGRNVEGTVSNCAIDGKLNAYFVGGIIGTDYSYKMVNSSIGEYGTPTSSSKYPITNLRNGVKYDGNDERCQYNKVGKSLIQNMLNMQEAFYSYNELYEGTDSEELVKANSVFGLFVGFTDRDMAVKTESGWAVKYENGYLIANLTASGTSPTSEYIISPKGVKEKPEQPETSEDEGEESEITLADDEVLVSAIDWLKGTDLKFSNTGYPFTFLFIVASENATSYEYWSPILGYSNEFIILSK